MAERPPLPSNPHRRSRQTRQLVRGRVTEFSVGAGRHSIWLSIISQKTSTTEYPIPFIHQPPQPPPSPRRSTSRSRHRLHPFTPPHHPATSSLFLIYPISCTTFSPLALSSLRHSHSPHTCHHSGWLLAVFRFVRLFTRLSVQVCVVFHIICTTRQTTVCEHNIIHAHAKLYLNTTGS